MISPWPSRNHSSQKQGCVFDQWPEKAAISLVELGIGDTTLF